MPIRRKENLSSREGNFHIFFRWKCSPRIGTRLKSLGCLVLDEISGEGSRSGDKGKRGIAEGGRKGLSAKLERRSIAGSYWAQESQPDLNYERADLVSIKVINFKFNNMVGAAGYNE